MRSSAGPSAGSSYAAASYLCTVMTAFARTAPSLEVPTESRLFVMGVVNLRNAENSDRSGFPGGPLVVGVGPLELGNVLYRPVAQFSLQPRQRSAERRQLVFDVPRRLLHHPPADHAVPFNSAECLGEHFL